MYSNGAEQMNQNVNEPDNERSPITGFQMFRRFGALVSNNRSTSNLDEMADGYVEFGVSDAERSGRTLGTITIIFVSCSSHNNCK